MSCLRLYVAQARSSCSLAPAELCSVPAPLSAGQPAAACCLYLYGPSGLMQSCRVVQEVLTRETPPGVILLALHPQQLDSHGYPGGAVAVLQRLHALGYTDISHSG